MMTTGTQTNTYHKYINLPFTIAPLPNFSQQGNKVLHYYINDYPFYPMEEWFNDLGLTLFLKEVFMVQTTQHHKGDGLYVLYLLIKQDNLSIGILHLKSLEIT
jgi:hypothetical protein